MSAGLGDPQSSFFVPGIELRFLSRPARSLVTVPIELSTPVE
jgi:hypothetical protein